MTTTPVPGLGRREHFDDRSRAYPIRARLTAAHFRTPRSFTWACSTVLDQGSEGSCVGHAWAHEIAARPKVHPADHALAMRIYNRAQQTDPWADTPPAEGTDVLDGAKAGVEFGYYSEYRWAFGLEEVVATIGYLGPVVLGISWYDGMFAPDARGLIAITGQVAGGHAILANGVNVRWPATLPIAQRSFANLNQDVSTVRLHNSWGAAWGVGGEAFLRLSDLQRLLSQGGEACIPTRK